MTIRYYIGIISVFAVIFTGQACYARQDPASAADEYQYSPVAFTQALELTRGVVAPAREGGLYFNHDDACHLAVANWGWEKASCDSVDKMLFSITEAMDTVIIEQPNSDGYITFDDWRKKDLNKQIDTIWNELQSGLKSQSENLGVTITAEDWFIYPTLNAEKQYLYYATKLNWDGEPTINVKASKFDRRGYVVFNMVPVDSRISAETLEASVEEVLSTYQPKSMMAYSDISEGDKIAAAGAVGVLAALAGVKFGKAAAVGLGALLLALGKKLWILIALPLVALKNRIFKKKV